MHVLTTMCVGQIPRSGEGIGSARRSAPLRANLRFVAHGRAAEANLTTFNVLGEKVQRRIAAGQRRRPRFAEICMTLKPHMGAPSHYRHPAPPPPCRPGALGAPAPSAPLKTCHCPSFRNATPPNVKLTHKPPPRGAKAEARLNEDSFGS
jgi:hypothetical protein